MKSKATLTIGIPTFKRPYKVIERIRELSQINYPKKIEILIADNNSPYEQFKKIQNAAKSYNHIKLIRNSENYGFSGNLYKIISNINSEYVMYCSDEDTINIKKIHKLIDYLNNKKPDFLCPFIKKKYHSFFQGRLISSRIKINSFRESSHYISGLVYKKSSTRKHFKNIYFLANNNTAAVLYPQTLVTAMTLLNGTGYWYSGRLISMGNPEKSYLNTNKSSYTSLKSRYEQILDFNKFFINLLKSNKLKKEDNHNINKIIKVINSWSFQHFRQGLRNEDLNIFRGFEESSKYHYSILYKNKKRLKKLAFDPLYYLSFLKFFIYKFFKIVK